LFLEILASLVLKLVIAALLLLQSTLVQSLKQTSTKTNHDFQITTGSLGK